MKKICSKLCVCSKNIPPSPRTPTYRCQVKKKFTTNNTNTTNNTTNNTNTNDNTNNTNNTNIQSSVESPSEYSLELDKTSESSEIMYTDYNHKYNTYIFKKYKTYHKEYYLNYYIDKDYPDIVRKIIIFNHYNYDERRLPFEGWLHHCLYCNCITGRDMMYIQYKKTYIYIQFCDKCKYNHINKHLSKDILNKLEIDIEKVLKEIKHKTFYI